MSDMNYVTSVVKVLEEPRKQMSVPDTIVVDIRAQFPQARSNTNQRLVTLVFWENLCDTLLDYYQLNDYLIIEGYMSTKRNETVEQGCRSSKCVEITVLKIYPFLLSKNL